MACSELKKKSFGEKTGNYKDVSFIWLKGYIYFCGFYINYQFKYVQISFLFLIFILYISYNFLSRGTITVSVWGE
jgi:hypothetical protein